MLMLTRLKRLVKHRWQSDQLLRGALCPQKLAQLTSAVQRSESLHTGEIRVCVETSLPFSYLWRPDSIAEITHQRALTMFSKLRVWDTADNNGVLIYLLLAEKRIEIIADRGVNSRVPAQTWSSIVASMRAEFKMNHFDAGLLLAIEQVCKLLTQHFPLTAEHTQVNELPNEPDIR